MPVYCEIDEKLLTYDLQLVPLIDSVTEDTLTLLKDIALSTGNIKNIHDRAVEKSKNFMGQDRIKLLESLDNLMIKIAIFNNNLFSDLSNDQKDKSGNMGLRIFLQNKGNKFTSRGKLEEEDINGIKGFESSYQDLSSGIKKMLLKYKEISQGLGSLDELLFIIDNTLYGLLTFRHNVKNLLINS